MRKFTEQELVRREKTKKLQELGLDAFGHKFEVSNYSLDIKEKFKDVEHDEFENRNDIVTVAGRIMFIRKMGKASFFTIQDKLGKIQIYISINDIGEDNYNLFKSADIGDIVGIKGKVMKTKTGEITIKCLEYTHLVKALRPLPEKFHGLTDIEMKKSIDEGCWKTRKTGRMLNFGYDETKPQRGTVDWIGFIDEQQKKYKISDNSLVVKALR